MVSIHFYIWKRKRYAVCYYISYLPYLQYRHLIPAPVNRASVSACSYKPHGQHVKNLVKHINEPRNLRIKATFSCEVIRESTPRKLDGNRACGRL